MAEFTYAGETFAAGEVSQFSLMEFAALADTIEDAPFAAMAAMFRLLEESVDPADFARFKDVARKNKASVDEVMKIVMDVVSASVDRPTSGSTESSDGPSSTELRSGSSVVDRVMTREAGRPDRQAGIARALRSA